jgi:hypothetical protein
MKELYILLAGLLVSAVSFAQAPSGMSYQAIVRDSGGDLVASTTVGMQISILAGTAQGTAVYTETQSPSTNANGLVSLEIGTGSTNDNFATIDWASDSYFIKTETDPTGGSNYSITGTSQLMSVPYALYAKASGSSIAGPQGIAGTNGNNGIDGVDGATGPQGIAGTNGNNGIDGIDGAAGPQGIAGTNGSKGIDGVDGATGPQGIAGTNGNNGINGVDGATGPIGGFTHYLGEDYLDGIIFYLYKGGDSAEHGLIVAKTESTAEWQTILTLVDANRSEDGAYNTNLMTNSPAKSYISTLGAAWYLPSVDECFLLYNNRYSAQKGLRAGGHSLLPSGTDSIRYWCSTEFGINGGFVFSFDRNQNGPVSSEYKKNINRVRGVRAF